MPEEGWEIAHAYMLCGWTHVGLMHVLMPTGIEAAEVHSVCEMLRIPPERWPDVLCGVQLMAAAARPILQKRALPQK